MKFFRAVWSILLLSMLLVHIGNSKQIELTNGLSFEGSSISISKGNHIFKVSKSDILHIEYGDSDYIRFKNGTDIETKIVKFIEKDYYIKVKDTILAKDTNSNRKFLFKLHGSNTIGANLAPTLVKSYLANIGAKDIEEIVNKKEEKQINATLQNGKKIKVEIYAHGSSTAFKDLRSSSCDIGMASRRVKDKEAKQLDDLCNMKSYKHEHIIAIDGVAIFVNPKNPIFKLTTKQIRDIYTGKITNWSEVGGDKGKINLYSRDNNSGTFDTFKHFILGKRKISKDAKRYEDNTKLSNDVSNDINGIGFGGLPYILKSKEIAISDGEMTIKPDRFTVATEDYPLSRRLYFYNINRENQNINDFIEFSLSKEGQKIVRSENFVDLNIKAFKPIITDKMPRIYKVLAKNLSRLSTSFRFEPNSRNLDNKAQRDLLRVVKYLKENIDIDGKKIYLIGFSDNRGSRRDNKILSKKRAKSVLYALKSKNIVVKKDMIIPLGQDYPVANNTDEKGRAKNRRVEIWIKG